MSTKVAPKRRKSAPKARTGCQTCKIRRVKCDEGRPNCLRCETTGRKCDGYNLDLAIEQPIAIIQSLSISIVGNAKEKRGFEYFTVKTGPELTGYYESITFWQKLILQASSADSSLRHAVIAIGSLHEEFTKQTLSYHGDTVGIGTAFAVKQYSKAIGTLRRSLYSGKQVPVTALMSCILFVCFDSLRGHFESAMVHLKSGLKILRDVRGGLVEDSYTIITDIVPVFRRLSVQAVQFIESRTISERRALFVDLSDISFTEETLPETFDSLAQARHFLNQAVDGLFRGLYLCDGDLPLSAQPIEAVETLAKYSPQFAAWDIAYEKFMNLNAKILTNKELRGAALLKIHHMSVNVIATVAPHPHDPRCTREVVQNDAAFVSATARFRVITDLSRTLIKAAELDIANNRPPLTFSTDLGLIGPLYYVCIRSQDFALRQEALELLLRCPRREGMWDSQACATMIKEFWDVQENYKAMPILDATGEKIPISRCVNLTFRDDMKWQWKRDLNVAAHKA